MVSPSSYNNSYASSPAGNYSNNSGNFSKPKKRYFNLPYFGNSDAGFSFNKKPLLIITAVFLFGLVGLFASYRLAPAKTNSVLGTDKRTNVDEAKASQSLNKDFAFPLKDEKGNQISKINFSFMSADLRDEIVIKGQKATAIKGRTFLILELKINNPSDKSVDINTRDYVRLTLNNSAEQLAPDIHNDPVTVQPISTKYTRLGFPISDSDKNLTLHIGEINGTKSEVPLNLH